MSQSICLFPSIQGDSSGWIEASGLLHFGFRKLSLFHGASGWVLVMQERLQSCRGNGSLLRKYIFSVFINGAPVPHLELLSSPATHNQRLENERRLPCPQQRRSHTVCAGTTL
jgi:hypothetical protein